MKKRAFTMAEVLITLGIIGVVAALTLPNVIANHKEKQTIVQLKKAYTLLSQAVNISRTDYADLHEWEDDSLEFFRNAITKQLNVVKSCSLPHDCSGLNDSITPVYVLNNGMVIQFASRKTNVPASFPYYYCSSSVTTKNATSSGVYAHYAFCGQINIDINGKKGPNKNGYDIFAFRVYNNGILPYGSVLDNGNDPGSQDGFEKCKEDKEGLMCTAWALYNENLDYTKCPEKLFWNGPHSCKEAD